MVAEFRVFNFIEGHDILKSCGKAVDIEEKKEKTF